MTIPAGHTRESSLFPGQIVSAAAWRPSQGNGYRSRNRGKKRGNRDSRYLEYSLFIGIVGSIVNPSAAFTISLSYPAFFAWPGWRSSSMGWRRGGQLNAFSRMDGLRTSSGVPLISGVSGLSNNTVEKLPAIS